MAEAERRVIRYGLWDRVGGVRKKNTWFIHKGIPRLMT